jgi:TolB-like protein/Tfp pilus assembly protein PilF
MSERPLPAPAVRFATFEVDFASHELRKRGLRLRLEEKPYQILTLLLEKPGQVVSRRTLREKLWPRTFVGFEQGLNTAVNKLRTLLGDSPQNPRFIETIPRVGYRFIAPVERVMRTSSTGSKKMLLVLPFENLSGDPAQQYFAEGLTEELIAQLGRINPKRLGVIARTSAIQYRGTKKTVSEIAQELKVDYVLEGSVRKDRRQLRITAQLIEAVDQTHLWAATYEHELRDILEIQDDVAQNVARAMALELLVPEKASQHVTDPAAHEAYLQGRFLFGQRTEECLRQAIEAFDVALKHDPDHAGALSGIAYSSIMLCWFGALYPRDAVPRAERTANRAIALDPENGEAQASLALIRYWYHWDWRGAEEAFLRAIELNPNFATARQWYSSFLNAMGRFEEGAEEQQRAMELDPLSLIIHMNAADPLFFSRKYELAIEHLSALLKRAPYFFPAMFNLGRAYIQNGQMAQAMETFEKAMQLSRNRTGLPVLAHAYAVAGRTPEARAMLKDLLETPSDRYIASPLIAQIYMGLGEMEGCFEWLHKGIEERAFWCVFMQVDPVYDAIRNDPRFQKVLQLVGFSPNRIAAPLQMPSPLPKKERARAAISSAGS